MSKADRIELLNSLAKQLNIHEAAALLAKVAEKRPVDKLTRFGLYPVTDIRSYTHMKNLEASHWIADEINFSADVNDFQDFTEEEKRPLLYSFGFFAIGDGQVANQIAFRMILTADNFNQQAFYITQLNNERVHCETYGKMIHELVKDPSQRKEIYDFVEKCQSIKAMSDMIEEAMTFPDGRRQELVTLAMTEYLIFTPLFCIIFWYRAYKPGKIPKIILANYQVAKDEATHCIQGCESYANLPADQKYTQEEIVEIIKVYVQSVKTFAQEVLHPVNLTDLTPDSVKLYIEHVADSILGQCGHELYYHTPNPFSWMTLLELNEKTNFYEGRVVKYSRFNVQESIDNAIRLSSEVVDTFKIDIESDPEDEDFLF